MVVVTGMIGVIGVIGVCVCVRVRPTNANNNTNLSVSLDSRLLLMKRVLQPSCNWASLKCCLKLPITTIPKPAVNTITPTIITAIFTNDQQLTMPNNRNNNTNEYHTKRIINSKYQANAILTNKHVPSFHHVTISAIKGALHSLS